MEYSEARRGMSGFPVEFAALGFLVDKPMHGYALRSRISEGLGPLWQIASSQLYQVLHRLEGRRLVNRAREAPSSGPSKAVYRVTAAGEQAFWAWATAPLDTMRNVRVEFAAKLYFLRRLNVGAVSTLIDRQLMALAAISQRILSDDRQGSDDPTLNAAWRAFQIATVDSFARWLQEQRSSLMTERENQA